MTKSLLKRYGLRVGSRVFTPQQAEIIESFGKGQAVMAGAGCGKTTTLVAKCLTLVKNNPEARFCAVSFTEKSVRDLKQSLAKGFLEEGTPFNSRAHWVKTIHGLCSTIIQEFPVYAGLQGGEKVLVEDESRNLWEQSIHLLWSQSENQEISDAVAKLLEIYSKKKLEELLLRLRSLIPFGVEEFIKKSTKEEVRALWLVFESVYQRYQHYKTRDAALDFNDLELLAFRALQHEAVQKHYQARFDLLLVDEFQDTNPIQGAILEKLAKPGFSNLCIVGDPKQSIYRFRDADVSVFTDLTSRLPQKHLLDTNYRSRPAILDFVNRVCAPIFEASELTYEPLAAGRPEDETDAVRVSRLITESEHTLAQFLKAEEGRGVDLSEYVILARSLRKDKTQKILDALENAQVPFLLGNGGRYYSDPRVQELVAFLRGWVSPKNNLSMVAALRSPWIGIDDETLHAWKDEYYEKFFLQSSHPIALALKEDYLNRTRLRPGQVLKKLWALPEMDEEILLSIATLWQKTEQFSSQGWRFEEVVQYLSRAIEEDQLEKEIPPPVAKGTVRILTVHGSKGLQFPRVILLDFDGPYRGGSSADLIWDRKKGVHLFNRDESGKKEKADAENEAWAELELRAKIAESKRLFYVAITRAQEELILAWKAEAAPLKPDSEPLKADHWRAWVESQGAPPIKDFDKNNASIVNLEAPAKSARKIFSADPKFQNQNSYRPRHSPSEWLVLNQCSLRYQKRYLQTFIDESASEAREPDLQQTAEKGERVHQLIEQENWDALVGEFKDAVTGKNQVQKLRTLVGETSLFATAHKELGFEIPLSDFEALVGMMDRLEVDEANGLIRVIDYKWTNKARAPADLLSHYLLQLQLYAWAASKMVAFKPKKIEAGLIHLTSTSVNAVWAPAEAFDSEKIDVAVQRLFKSAKTALTRLERNEENPATKGDHCIYCEFQATCPVFSL